MQFIRPRVGVAGAAFWVVVVEVVLLFAESGTDFDVVVSEDVGAFFVVVVVAVLVVEDGPNFDVVVKEDAGAFFMLSS